MKNKFLVFALALLLLVLAGNSVEACKYVDTSPTRLSCTIADTALTNGKICLNDNCTLQLQIVKINDSTVNFISPDTQKVLFSLQDDFLTFKRYDLRDSEYENFSIGQLNNFCKEDWTNILSSYYPVSKDEKIVNTLGRDYYVLELSKANNLIDQNIENIFECRRLKSKKLGDYIYLDYDSSKLYCEPVIGYCAFGNEINYFLLPFYLLLHFRLTFVPYLVPYLLLAWLVMIFVRKMKINATLQASFKLSWKNFGIPLIITIFLFLAASTFFVATFYWASVLLLLQYLTVSSISYFKKLKKIKNS